MDQQNQNSRTRLGARKYARAIVGHLDSWDNLTDGLAGGPARRRLDNTMITLALTNAGSRPVSDPNDLLAVVATWPEEWRDSFAEREAIMAIDASHPYVSAIREAFEDVVRVGKLVGYKLPTP